VTTSMNDAVKMIRLTPDLMVSPDRLPADLRRRWDQVQSRKSAGENVKGIIEVLLREIQGECGIDLLMRAAQRADVHPDHRHGGARCGHQTAFGQGG
jgi:hypothetical protein